MAGKKNRGVVNAPARAQFAPAEPIVVSGHDAEGNAVLLDRKTGEVVLYIDGCIVTYRDRSGEDEIVDHSTGLCVEKYNDYFIEYLAEGSGSVVCDRITGAQAISHDDYIAEFIDKGGNYIIRNRENGAVISEDLYEEVAAIAQRDRGSVDPIIVSWLLTAEFSGVSHDDWAKMRLSTADFVRAGLSKKTKGPPLYPTARKSDKNKPVLLKANARKLLIVLNREIAGIKSSIPENLLWWNQPSESNQWYQFRPKYGTNEYIWELPEQYYDIHALRLGLINFIKRVSECDYYEPIDPDESNEEYLVDRCEKQISWVESILNGLPPENIIPQLMWWEQAGPGARVIFKPKFGAKEFLWPNGGCEEYPNLNELLIGMKQFIGRVLSGKHQAPHIL